MILHPSFHARTMPDKTAYRMAGSGAAISYGELDLVSNQGAQLFRSLGLQPQEHIALLAENSLNFLEICWAAQRCGLYYTAISPHLTPGEIAYIATDCGAKVFITTERLADIGGEAAEMIPAEVIRYMSGHAAAGWLSWDAAIAAMPAVPITDESPAARCSIPRERRGGPRASSGHSLTSRSAPGRRSPISCAAGCAAWTRTRSTCRRHRSITQRRCCSRRSPRRSAQPRSSWRGSTPKNS